MTSRERFFRTVTHQNPDRAVFDLCGSPQTFVDYPVTKKALAELLHLSGEKQGDYCVDERILCALNIDTRLIGGMPTPDTAHCREENGIFYNAFGIGVRSVGDHYEMCYHPLQDCTLEEVENFELPDPSKIDRRLLEQWAARAEFLHRETDYAIIAEHPVLGVFELGCWMFGFDDYLYRFAAEPEVVHAFSKRILAYQKEVIALYYGALGAYIDCTTSGDDFGTQKAPFLSNKMFDELIAPYFKERIAYTKQFTHAFYKHHTCGSVFSLIPSLLDCGIAILNPIQPGVYQMEPERLKETFGDKLTFWGGIDTQQLLPHGTPSAIRKEVQRILSILDKNGGYILAPAHTIQYDVPAENLLALYDGAMEYYGLSSVFI